jgi:hypothetical protein
LPSGSPEAREAMHDTVMKVVEKHCSERYLLEAFREPSDATAFIERAAQQLADEAPATKKEDVYKINVLNMTKLGRRHSYFVPKFAEMLKKDHATSPATSASLIILPNTGVWGCSEDTWQAIEEARDELRRKLEERENDLDVRRVDAVFDHTTMYSSTRELAVNALMVISKQAAATEKNQRASVFAKGLLWKRRAVPQLVSVMAREDFVNFEKPHEPFDTGNRCARFETKWHYTGEHLYSCFLTAMMSSASGTQSLLFSSDRVHVRDWCAWDDQLARCVMCWAFRMQGASGKAPVMAYSGIAYGTADRKTKSVASEVVASVENIKVAIRENMKQALREKKFRVPGVDVQVDEPKGSDGGGAPVLNESAFEVCCPRANMTLPVKEEYYKVFKAAPAALRTAFEKLIGSHDAVFNPDSKPYSSKRPLSEVSPASAGDEGSEQAALFPRLADDPKTIEDLTGVVRVPGHKAHFDVVVDEDGHLYLYGKADGVVPVAPELCAFRGQYLIGGPANVAKAAAEDTIPWEVDTDEVKISATCRPALEKPLGPEPLTVRDFLKYLEENGIVRTKLIQHTVNKSEGGSTYDIKPVDAQVFKPDSSDKYTKAPQVHCLGNFVDLGAVKESPHVDVVHRVAFEKQSNLIKSGFPGIFLKRQYRIKEGDLLKLT